MTGKSKVVGIRLSAARLQTYVRAAANDSARAVDVAVQADGARINQVFVMGFEAE